MLKINCVGFVLACGAVAGCWASGGACAQEDGGDSMHRFFRNDAQEADVPAEEADPRAGETAQLLYWRTLTLGQGCVWDFGEGLWLGIAGGGGKLFLCGGTDGAITAEVTDGSTVKVVTKERLTVEMVDRWYALMKETEAGKIPARGAIHARGDSFCAANGKLYSLAINNWGPDTPGLFLQSLKDGQLEWSYFAELPKKVVHGLVNAIGGAPFCVTAEEELVIAGVSDDDRAVRIYDTNNGLKEIVYFRKAGEQGEVEPAPPGVRVIRIEAEIKVCSTVACMRDGSLVVSDDDVVVWFERNGTLIGRWDVDEWHDECIGAGESFVVLYSLQANRVSLLDASGKKICSAIWLHPEQVGPRAVVVDSETVVLTSSMMYSPKLPRLDQLHFMRVVRGRAGGEGAPTLPEGGERAPGAGDVVPGAEEPAPETVDEVVCAGWPFDAREAKRRQEEAARALGMPVEKELDLGAGVKMKLRLIPAGEFVMGSPASEKERNIGEGPQHKVEITKSFYMGIHELTKGQYDHFVEASGYKGRNDANDNYLRHHRDWGEGTPVDAGYPVICVGWQNAQEFCGWLGRTSGMKVRLPTEAEWEWACRAGTATPFSTGETISTDQANYDGRRPDGAGGWVGTFRDRTTPVGNFAPNAWGLYDAHGNVSEWCQDGLEFYMGPGMDRPRAFLHPEVRGGNWVSRMEYCRSAARGSSSPLTAALNYGFHIVCVPQP